MVGLPSHPPKAGVQPPSFPAISLLSRPVASRYYVPVWPGDLNFDKRITVADILPIGYFYGSTGPVRPNASLQWKAQPSALWGFDKTNKKSSAYKTFSDGTPDGIINLADQTSIGFNLGQIHARAAVVIEKEVQKKSYRLADIPAIYVNIPDTEVQPASLPKNEAVTLTLGSPSAPLNNVYGIAFDLFFNPAAVNVNAITANYTGSIFGTLGTNFTRIEDRTALSSGRFSIGMTRYNTNGINATGGTLVTITIPLLGSAPSGSFKIKTVPAGCNDPSGADLAVAGSSASLIINTSNSCLANYWQGTVSNAWEDASNWSCGIVPNAETDVFISSLNPHFPIVRSAAVCKSLKVEKGMQVMVSDGFKLDIRSGGK